MTDYSNDEEERPMDVSGGTPTASAVEQPQADAAAQEVELRDWLQELEAGTQAWLDEVTSGRWPPFSSEVYGHND